VILRLMAKRRPYTKPEIIRIEIDPAFTLMQASPPINPMMMPTGTKGTDTPFTSPFDDKPFS
jgi:hypothetical protein